MWGILEQLDDTIRVTLGEFFMRFFLYECPVQGRCQALDDF